MRLLLQSLIFWLPLLLLTSISVWTIYTSVKRNTKDLVTIKSLYPGIPKVRQRGEVSIWIGSMMMMLAVGLAVGYGTRDHELASRIVPYTDVLILPPSQVDVDFDIQPARMKPIPSKICKSVVDWKFGEMLDDLVFEQLNGCKRVISYHRPKGVKNVAAEIR